MSFFSKNNAARNDQETKGQNGRPSQVVSLHQARTPQQEMAQELGMSPTQFTMVTKAVRELGLPEMIGATKVRVTKGRLSVSPYILLTLVKRSNQLEDMQVHDNGETTFVTVKRFGQTAHKESFSIAEAHRLHLLTAEHWLKFPTEMRTQRALVAALRMVFPEITFGLSSHEEMGLLVDRTGDVLQGSLPVKTWRVTKLLWNKLVAQYQHTAGKPSTALATVRAVEPAPALLTPALPDLPAKVATETRTLGSAQYRQIGDGAPDSMPYSEF